jgi:Dolichyl-phosphate-mannose-protein mannosyltransferase
MPAGDASRLSLARQPLILLLVLLAAFAVRMHHLDVAEFTGDEGFSYVFNLNTLPEMVRKTLEMVEPHPIGSYVIQQLWTGLAGVSPFGYRASSVFFGVIACALMFPLARRLGLSREHPWAPQVSVALFALNAYAVYYSREVRMYSILLALVLLSSYLMLRLLARPRWGVWAGYVLTSAAALYVHYYAGLVFVAQNVHALLYLLAERRLRVLPAWIGAQLAILALFAPWFLYTRAIFFAYRGNNDLYIGLWQALSEIIGSFTIGDQAIAWFTPVTLVFLVLAAAGAWRLWRAGRLGRAAVLWLLLAGALPIALGWAWSQGRATYAVRYFITTLPPLLMLVAVGALTLFARQQPAAARRAPGAPALAAVLALAGITGFALERLFTVNVDGKPQIWRTFIRTVDQYSAGLPAGVIRPALNYPNPVFSYYYRDRGDYVTIPFKPGDPASAEQLVAELMGSGVKRIVFQDWPTWWDDRAIAATALSRSYAEIATDASGPWKVRVYARVAPDELQPVGLAFGERITLAALRVRADSAARLVELSWQLRAGEQPLRGSEKLFAHVTPADAPNDVKAQIDLPVDAAQLALPVNTVGIRLPADLPPGRYRLRFGFYDPGEAGSPRLLTAAGEDAYSSAVFSLP